MNRYRRQRIFDQYVCASQNPCWASLAELELTLGANAGRPLAKLPELSEEAMAKLATLKKRLMKNPKFRKEYEKADAEFSIVEALIHARTIAKLSQAEVAKRIGTTQSAIARLEAGNTEPTIPTLRRYAEATGKKLQIKLAG